MEEKKTIKGIRLLAWIVVIIGVWSSFSWARLLLSSEKLSSYIANMNRIGMVFSHLSFKVYVLGVIVILLVSIIAGILLIKLKEAGRKLFMVTLVSFPSYNVLWIVANLIMRRSIGLFIMNIVMGIIFCSILIHYLTRPKVKEQFK